MPPGLGELRRLEGLQLEGCPLPALEAQLYAAGPLLLVQVRGGVCVIKWCVMSLMCVCKGTPR